MLLPELLKYLFSPCACGIYGCAHVLQNNLLSFFRQKITDTHSTKLETYQTTNKDHAK